MPDLGRLQTMFHALGPFQNLNECWSDSSGHGLLQFHYGAWTDAAGPESQEM
jgi:hypothetical protein